MYAGAFSSNNQDAIKICLEHSSASEDRLIDKKDANKINMDIENDDNSNTNENEVVCTNSEGEGNNDDSISHTFDFLGTGEKFIIIRELPITRADNPFGSETNPEVIITLYYNM